MEKRQWCVLAGLVALGEAADGEDEVGRVGGEESRGGDVPRVLEEVG